MQDGGHSGTLASVASPSGLVRSVVSCIGGRRDGGLDCSCFNGTKEHEALASDECIPLSGDDSVRTRRAGDRSLGVAALQVLLSKEGREGSGTATTCTADAVNAAASIVESKEMGGVEGIDIETSAYFRAAQTLVLGHISTILSALLDDSGGGGDGVSPHPDLVAHCRPLPSMPTTSQAIATWVGDYLRGFPGPLKDVLRALGSSAGGSLLFEALSGAGRREGIGENGGGNGNVPDTRTEGSALLVDQDDRVGRSEASSSVVCCSDECNPAWDGLGLQSVSSLPYHCRIQAAFFVAEGLARSKALAPDDAGGMDAATACDVARVVRLFAERLSFVPRGAEEVWRVMKLEAVEGASTTPPPIRTTVVSDPHSYWMVADSVILLRCIECLVVDSSREEGGRAAPWVRYYDHVITRSQQTALAKTTQPRPPPSWVLEDERAEGGYSPPSSLSSSSSSLKEVDALSAALQAALPFASRPCGLAKPSVWYYWSLHGGVEQATAAATEAATAAAAIAATLAATASATTGEATKRAALQKEGGVGGGDSSASAAAIRRMRTGAFALGDNAWLDTWRCRPIARAHQQAADSILAALWCGTGAGVGTGDNDGNDDDGGDCDGDGGGGGGGASTVGSGRIRSRRRVGRLLQELRNVASGDKWKDNPSAATCIYAIVMAVRTLDAGGKTSDQSLGSMGGDNLGHVLPLLFLLVDDYKEEHQIFGLEGLLHVLRHVTPSEMQRHGDITLEVLRRCLVIRDARTLELALVCLVECLALLEPARPEDPGQRRLALVGKIVEDAARLAHRHDLGLVYLRAMRPLLCAVGIHACAHLASLLPWLLRLVTRTSIGSLGDDIQSSRTAETRSAAAGCLTVITHGCWPRVTAHRSKLLSAIVRGWLITADDDGGGSGGGGGGAGGSEEEEEGMGEGEGKVGGVGGSNSRPDAGSENVGSDALPPHRQTILDLAHTFAAACDDSGAWALESLGAIARALEAKAGGPTPATVKLQQLRARVGEGVGVADGGGGEKPP